MGLSEIFTDPMKAAKDGWNGIKNGFNAATDFVSETLVNKPIEATKNLVTSVTNVEPKSLAGTMTAVGTTVTSPLRQVWDSVADAILPKPVKTVVENVGLAALAATPLGLATLTVTKVSENLWVSKDNKVSIEKVQSFDTNAGGLEIGDLWELYDKKQGVSADAAKDSKTSVKDAVTANSQIIDFTANIYPGKQDVTRAGDKAAENKEAQRTYTNKRGEQVKVEVKDGVIRYQSTKDGQVVTDATQTPDQSTLSYKGEIATLQTKTGVLTLSTDHAKILKDDRHAVVELENGVTLKRRGRDIEILRPNHRPERVRVNKMEISKNIEMYGKSADLEAEAKERALEPTSARPEVEVKVKETGEALILLNKENSLISVRQDGSYIVKLGNGRTILLDSNGKQHLFQDGNWVEANQSIVSELASALADSSVKIIDGKITFAGGNIDTNKGNIQVLDENQQLQNIAIDRTCAPDGTPTSADGQPVVTVTNQDKTVVAHGNDVVETRTVDGFNYTVRLSEGSVDTQYIKITPVEIRVKHDDGRRDTVVTEDNRVLFEEGEGPELHNDGSMKLDEETETDREGNVRSGDWHAGAYTGSYSVERARFEGRAVVAAASARDVASSIYAKALSGRITAGDIDALKTNLSDVQSMINMLAAAGCADLIPQLQMSCGAILETLSFAAPRIASSAVHVNRGFGIAA